MIDFAKLPKEPVAAFRQVLFEAGSLLPAKNTKIEQFLQQDQQSYDRLLILLRGAKQIAKRIGDEDVLDIAKRNLVVGLGENSADIKNRIFNTTSALVVFEMDRHFIGSDEIEEFDEAQVPPKERDEIRSYLQRARDLAAKAKFMEDPVRRSFLHKISLAESELFKEKVGFQAFLAAAYEGSRLLRRFGEDAQPIAEAIEKARTKTEAHVSGYKQIQAAEKPKQITKQQDHHEK